MENKDVKEIAKAVRQEEMKEGVRIDFGSPDFSLMVKGNELEKCESAFSRLFEKCSESVKRKKEEKQGHYG